MAAGFFIQLKNIQRKDEHPGTLFMGEDQKPFSD
jgi:hypothetical protein